MKFPGQSKFYVIFMLCAFSENMAKNRLYGNFGLTLVICTCI